MFADSAEIAGPERALPYMICVDDLSEIKNAAKEIRLGSIKE